MLRSFVVFLYLSFFFSLFNDHSKANFQSLRFAPYGAFVFQLSLSSGGSGHRNLIPTNGGERTPEAPRIGGFALYIFSVARRKEFAGSHLKLYDSVAPLRGSFRSKKIQADSVATLRGNPSRWRKSLRSLWLRADSVATRRERKADSVSRADSVATLKSYQID